VKYNTRSPKKCIDESSNNHKDTTSNTSSKSIKSTKLNVKESNSNVYEHHNQHVYTNSNVNGRANKTNQSNITNKANNTNNTNNTTSIAQTQSLPINQPMNHVSIMELRKQMKMKTFGSTTKVAYNDKDISYGNVSNNIVFSTETLHNIDDHKTEISFNHNDIDHHNIEGVIKKQKIADNISSNTNIDFDTNVKSTPESTQIAKPAGNTVILLSKVPDLQKVPKIESTNITAARKKVTGSIFTVYPRHRVVPDE
jgi:hypothetical protein